MIVVEGPDGSGKSTLVAQLCSLFDLKEGKRATTNRDHLYLTTRQDTYTALSKDLVEEKPTVWDRLYYSDFVYAPIQNRPIAFNKTDCRVIEALMGTLQTLVIWCLPPLEVVRANAAKEHQMEGVNQNIDEIYRTYRSMCIVTPLRGVTTTVYNYEYKNLRRIEDMVTKHIKLREPRTFKPYVEENA